MCAFVDTTVATTRSSQAEMWIPRCFRLAGSPPSQMHWILSGGGRQVAQGDFNVIPDIYHNRTDAPFCIRKETQKMVDPKSSWVQQFLHGSLPSHWAGPGEMFSLHLYCEFNSHPATLWSHSSHLPQMWFSWAAKFQSLRLPPRNRSPLVPMGEWAAAKGSKRTLAKTTDRSHGRLTELLNSNCIQLRLSQQVGLPLKQAGRDLTEVVSTALELPFPPSSWSQVQMRHSHQTAGLMMASCSCKKNATWHTSGVAHMLHVCLPSYPQKWKSKKRMWLKTQPWKHIQIQILISL